MAGTLAEIARNTLPGEFRRIDPSSARIVLLEGGSRVLQAMPEDLSLRAREQLEKLGVEVRLDARVTGIDGGSVEVMPGAGGDSYAIATRCVVWAAGVAASPLGRQLAEALGVATIGPGVSPSSPTSACPPTRRSA